jgi:hypothetical protein
VDNHAPNQPRRSAAAEEIATNPPSSAPAGAVGGPVQPDRGIVLHDTRRDIGATLRFRRRHGSEHLAEHPAGMAAAKARRAH